MPDIAAEENMAHQDVGGVAVESDDEQAAGLLSLPTTGLGAQGWEMPMRWCGPVGSA